MIVALEVDRDVDLALFSRYLNQIGIAHRIHEEGDLQVVWVRTEADREQVKHLWERIARGEARLEAQQRPGGRGTHFLDQLRRVPLTAALVIVSLIFFPATLGVEDGQLSELFRAMTFVAVEQREQYFVFAPLINTFESGEWWRLISPMFLHFGIMHIVFNLLWVWVVGGRIEMVKGAPTLLLVVLVSSLCANFFQYLMSGPALFGGMSGVVFGLLGFAMVWSRLVPRRSMGLPAGVYFFMLGFLALGFLGVFDFLLPGTLANGAHLGGLVAGLAIGAVAGVLENDADRQSS